MQNKIQGIFGNSHILNLKNIKTLLILIFFFNVKVCRDMPLFAPASSSQRT